MEKQNETTSPQRFLRGAGGGTGRSRNTGKGSVRGQAWPALPGRVSKGGQTLQGLPRGGGRCSKQEGAGRDSSSPIGPHHRESRWLQSSNRVREARPTPHLLPQLGPGRHAQLPETGALHCPKNKQGYNFQKLPPEDSHCLRGDLISLGKRERKGGKRFSPGGYSSSRYVLGIPPAGGRDHLWPPRAGLKRASWVRALPRVRKRLFGFRHTKLYSKTRANSALQLSSAQSFPSLDSLSSSGQ